jgi:hypothetical protein
MPHARRAPLPAGRQGRTMKMGFHCSLACNGIGGFATLNPPYSWFGSYFFVSCIYAMRYALCLPAGRQALCDFLAEKGVDDVAFFPGQR